MAIRSVPVSCSLGAEPVSMSTIHRSSFSARRVSDYCSLSDRVFYYRYSSFSFHRAFLVC